MVAGPRLISAQDLIVAADYGQIYIYSASSLDELDVYEAALDDARNSGRYVGVRPGFIDLMTPGQYNFETPLRLEVWSADPPDDRNHWDHEVDADLDIPDGQIFFEASGGGPTTSAGIPAGAYRARISGRGFTEMGFAGAEGTDTYRLRLWPRSRQTDPVLRKCWPGWDSTPEPDPRALPANLCVQTDERRQYWMTDDLWLPDWDSDPGWIKAPRPEDKLVSLLMEGHIAAVFTAGPREVDVLAEFRTAPAARDPDRFDDIAEVTMPLHIQRIAFAYLDGRFGPWLGGYMPQEYPQDLDDLRDYRVRFSAMRTYREHAEYHLIQIWPADAGADGK
jgi:hypothetical protein